MGEGKREREGRTVGRQQAEGSVIWCCRGDLGYPAGSESEHRFCVFELNYIRVGAPGCGTEPLVLEEVKSTSDMLNSINRKLCV